MCVSLIAWWRNNRSGPIRPDLVKTGADDIQSYISQQSDATMANDAVDVVDSQQSVHPESQYVSPLLEWCTFIITSWMTVLH